MKLFTRQVHLRGTPQEVVGYHTEMQAFASEIAGRDIAMWNVVMGAPGGTVAYTTPVEGLADLGNMMRAVLGHAEYHEKTSWAADRVMTPTEDSLADVLHGEIGEERPPVGTFGVVTSALMANGAYESAVGWGVEMAQFAGDVGGIPVMFTIDNFGAFGRVNWIALGSEEDVGNSLDALSANADYMQRLGQTADLFIPGSGNRMLAYRAA